MPVIFERTTCLLCGRAIRENDEFETVPSIFSGPGDRFFRYNDSAVHTHCFLNDENHREIRELVKAVRTAYAQKKCRICGNEIKSPDEMIFVPVLSSCEENPLFRFNCTAFHRKCFSLSEAAQEMGDREISNL